MSVVVELKRVVRSVPVRAAAATALLVSMLLAGCEEEAPTASSSVVAAESVAPGARRVRSEGEKIYDLYCAGCHGPGGKGSPDLTEQWQNVKLDGTADDLLRTAALIRDYEEGSEMSAYGGMLTEEEIESVAGYVLSLRKNESD